MIHPPPECGIRCRIRAHDVSSSPRVQHPVSPEHHRGIEPRRSGLQPDLLRQSCGAVVLAGHRGIEPRGQPGLEPSALTQSVPQAVRLFEPSPGIEPDPPPYQGGVPSTWTSRALMELELQPHVSLNGQWPGEESNLTACGKWFTATRSSQRLASRARQSISGGPHRT